jgi:hypothetical protein
MIGNATTDQHSPRRRRRLLVTPNVVNHPILSWAHQSLAGAINEYTVEGDKGVGMGMGMGTDSIQEVKARYKATLLGRDRDRDHDHNDGQAAAPDADADAADVVVHTFERDPVR